MKAVMFDKEKAFLTNVPLPSFDDAGDKLLIKVHAAAQNPKGILWLYDIQSFWIFSLLRIIPYYFESFYWLILLDHKAHFILNLPDAVEGSDISGVVEKIGKNAHSYDLKV